VAHKAQFKARSVTAKAAAKQEEDFSPANWTSIQGRN
jgi:hypothetical protein